MGGLPTLRGPGSLPPHPFSLLLSLAPAGWVGPSGSSSWAWALGAPLLSHQLALVSCKAGSGAPGQSRGRGADQSRLPSLLTLPHTGPREAQQGEIKLQHFHPRRVRVGRDPSRLPWNSRQGGGEHRSLHQLQRSELLAPCSSHSLEK